MSDPMTNVAIEDVLSSIRRLVSEDARMRPVPLRADQPDAEEAAAAADVVTPDSGRLVLTPALRVSADAPQAEAAPFVLDQPMTEAEQAPEAPQDALEEAAMAWEDHHAAADAPAVTPPDSDLTEDVVLSEDFFASVLDAIAEPADDAATDDAAAAQTEPAEAWAAADDAAPHDVDMAPDAEVQDEAMAMAEADLDSDPAPELSTSYLEDSDFVFASTRDGAPRATDTGQAAAADMHPPIEDDLSADRDLLLRDDEAILDEETLRELVADIVRQELQGALGERITRNVRKLVRREIHRALTSQELE
jgi:hypothetical protein